MKYLKEKSKKNRNPLMIPVIILGVLVVVLVVLRLWSPQKDSGNGEANLPDGTTTSTGSSGVENSAANEDITDAEDETVSGTEESGETTTEHGETLPTETTVPREMMNVESPYVDFEYPAEWEPYLKHESKEEDGIYSDTYYCCIQGQEIEMFTIWFNAPETGTLIGYLEEDGEQIAFSVTSTDAVPDESWPKEDRDIYSAMVYGINNIIWSVTEEENFIE